MRLTCNQENQFQTLKEAHGQVAPMVERRFEGPRDAGSNPALSTRKMICDQETG